MDRRSRSSFLQASNPYDSENNRGPCDYDVRANLSLGAVFELPDLGAGRVGSGWQMATSSPRSAAGRSRRASATAIDRVRASAPFGPIAHGEIEDEPRDPDRYVANASTAFSDPAPGTLGTCGRSSGRLPGFAQWDLSVLKNVTVKNDIRVQFRWEIFNVLNRANFGVLQSTNVRSGIFGTIGSTPDVDAANPVMSQARGRCNGP